MFYVYCEKANHQQDYLNVFDTREQAIKFMYKCYKIDDPVNIGEYYYFMKEH